MAALSMSESLHLLLMTIRFPGVSLIHTEDAASLTCTAHRVRQHHVSADPVARRRTNGCRSHHQWEHVCQFLARCKTHAGHMLDQ